VPNRKSPPAVLLRESYREGGRTVKRTLANLSMLPPEAVAALRAALKGEHLVEAGSLFEVESSLPCGHVRAVRTAMSRLGMRDLVSSKPCPERDIVLAMIAQRIIEPGSKLETVSMFGDSTLAQEFGVQDVDENDLYAAMDWLAASQPFIERKLAGRHLEEGATVLYDVSSSSYYGKQCPLAKRGYNRDGLRLPGIVYGLMTDTDGRPVAVRVYPGDTADPVTVPDQIDRLRGGFGIARFVFVGDRGMLTNTQIDRLRQQEGCGWISCLRSSDIRRLLETRDPSGAPLFTQGNLAEIIHPDFPGERLVACYNPVLAMDRACVRGELLESTEKELARLRDHVGRRRKKPLTAAEIGVRAGRVINRYKVAKHFRLDIADNHFGWERDTESIAREAALDGIYVVRTSETPESLSAPDAVRAYKRLGDVEQAFRTFKGVDLLIRPIYHRLEDRVRAHVLLCMLAYYVEWHMRQALAPLLYADEELEAARASRDPVAKAQPSENLKRKRARKRTQDGLRLRRWDGLLGALSTQVRNTCCFGEGRTAVRFTRDTMPKAFQLLEADHACWRNNKGVPMYAERENGAGKRVECLPARVCA
jgi:transposase